MEIGQSYPLGAHPSIDTGRRVERPTGDGAATATADARRGGEGVINHIAIDTFGALASDPASLREEINRESGALTRRINELLGENGIDTAPPYQLRGTREGGVEVLGNHPDKARIEALINQHPELTSQFNGISARSSLTRAIEQASDFQRAYRGNARSAVAQYAGLFNAEPPRFNLAIEGGEGRGYFTRG